MTALREKPRLGPGSHPGRRTVTAVALITALVVGALVATLTLTGAREPADALDLLTGTAWLSNRQTGTVSEVGGYSGKVEAQATIGRPGDPFTVVQRPDGAYVLDERSGKLSRIDDTSLAVAASTTAGGTPSSLQVIPTTGVTWVLDRSSGLVQRAQPTTLRPDGAQVPLGAATGSAVADAAGNLWVPVPSGRLVAEISPSGTVSRHRVPGAGAGLQAVSTANGIWAVDPATGTARSLVDVDTHPVSLPVPAPGSTPLVGSTPTGADVVVVEGSHVLIVDTTEATLSSLDTPTDTGATQLAVTPSEAYLLDSSADQLESVDLAGPSLAAPVPVPPGSDQLVAQDQLLFVNDQNSPQAVIVNDQGQVTPVDKYTTTPTPTPGPSNATAPTVVATVPGPSPDPVAVPSPGLGTGSVGSGGGSVQPVLTLPTLPTTTVPPATDPTSTTTATTAPPTTAPPTTPAPSTTTTTTPGVPGAPTSVKAVASTTDQDLDVTWQAPDDTGGKPITDYQVEYSVPGASKGQFVDAKKALSTTLTGLTDGTEYCVQVQAANSVGTGPASTPPSCATPAQHVPSAPTAVTASPSAKGQVTVSWGASSDPGGTITGYEITGGPAPETAGPTATHLDVSSLADATSYTFSVTAEATVGGTAEKSTTVAAPSVETYAVPGGVTLASTQKSIATGNVAAGQADAINASWSAAAANDGQTVTYDVTASATGQSTRSDQTTQTSDSFSGLASNVTYTFTVTPTDAAGAGPATAGSASTWDRTPVYECTAPAGFKYDTADDGACGPSAGFSWVDNKVSPQPTYAIPLYLFTDGSSDFWAISTTSYPKAGTWTDEGVVAYVFPSATGESASTQWCEYDAPAGYWEIVPYGGTYTDSDGTCAQSWYN